MTITHRMTGTPEYRSWASMLNRCRNVKRSTFKDYGGRGISVCKRWLGAKGFDNFFRDMGPKPTAKHGVERINNDRGYSPGNCKWATQTEQCNNKRTTLFVWIKGEKVPLAIACRRFRLPYITVYMRIKKLEWSEFDALTTPVGLSR